jgi:hypothetical protein
MVAAVEVHEFAGRAETETTWVGDSAILAEWSGQRTVSGETEDRAVASPFTPLTLLIRIRVMSG